MHGFSFWLINTKFIQRQPGQSTIHWLACVHITLPNIILIIIPHKIAFTLSRSCTASRLYIKLGANTCSITLPHTCSHATAATVTHPVWHAPCCSRRAYEQPPNASTQSELMMSHSKMPVCSHLFVECSHAYCHCA